MRKHIYVKPLCTGSNDWITLEATPIVSLWDDLIRYGIRIFLLNLWYYIRPWD